MPPPLPRVVKQEVEDQDDSLLPSKVKHKHKRRRASLTFSSAPFDPRRPFGGSDPPSRTSSPTISHSHGWCHIPPPPPRPTPILDLIKQETTEEESDLSDLEPSPALPSRHSSPLSDLSDLSDDTEEEDDPDLPSALVGATERRRPAGSSSGRQGKRRKVEEVEDDSEQEESEQEEEDERVWCTCEGEVDGGEVCPHFSSPFFPAPFRLRLTLLPSADDSLRFAPLPGRMVSPRLCRAQASAGGRRGVEVRELFGGR